MLATLFLNMFYGGKLKSMPPKLISDDGKQIVIRPLAYCKEKDIENYAVAKEFPIIPCNLCGSQPNLQRQVVKEMLNTWDRQYPGRLETMFSAMQIILSKFCFKTYVSPPHQNSSILALNIGPLNSFFKYEIT